jgi:uncharacterized membrane protein YeaQ/YmgE (transglycosylase-associated protein family)
MTMLVLLTLGAAVGWLTAIWTRQDSLAQSLTNIALGAIGALGGMVVTGDQPDSLAISVESLVFGVIGAALMLLLAAIFRRQIVR